MKKIIGDGKNIKNIYSLVYVLEDIESQQNPLEKILDV